MINALLYQIICYKWTCNIALMAVLFLNYFVITDNLSCLCVHKISVLWKVESWESLECRWLMKVEPSHSKDAHSSASIVCQVGLRLHPHFSVFYFGNSEDFYRDFSDSKSVFKNILVTKCACAFGNNHSSCRYFQEWAFHYAMMN